MKTSPDCIPCVLRQALLAGRKVSGDEWLHRKLLHEVMAHLQEDELDKTPAEVLSGSLETAARMLGAADPFAPERALWGTKAQALEPGLRAAVAGAPDRLAAAVRVAVAANAIDAVVLGSLDPERVLAEALTRPLVVDQSAALSAALAGAKDVLYCLDNAGEVWLDRLLIEQVAPGRRLGVVVRGAPILTDATEEEARAAGLHNYGDLLTTGSDSMGISLALCSSEFKRRYSAADLVIAKGSANFQTLEEAPGHRFFLLVVKCARVAAHLGLAVGDGVVAERKAEKPAPRARRAPVTRAAHEGVAKPAGDDGRGAVR